MVQRTIMAADVNRMDSTPQQLHGNYGASCGASNLQGAGPFRATELWNDIISHLKREVHVKRRRLKMKSYDSCFTGTDAVDVVLQRLQDEKVNFSKEVNREKAFKLCKLLMENNVFEPVSSKPGVEDSKTEFDDSTTKLFRFIDDESKENRTLDSSGTSDNASETSDNAGKVGEMVSQAADGDDSTSSRHSYIVQELMDITGAWKRHSARCLRKITPGRFAPRRGSSTCDGDTPRSRRHKLLPSTAPCIEEEESSAVLQEVRQEVVIGRLLTLVDIPILDGMLSFDSSASPPQNNRQTLAYSNLAFKRHGSMSSLFEQKDEDSWMEAATDCLECCPKGSDVLDLSLTEETEDLRKKRMFSAIAEHYTSLTPPLWPDHFTDLQLALLNLLMQGRRGTVLQALQLSMMLLASSMQEEIYRILTFMQYAVDVKAMRLSNKISNHECLEQVFTGAILKNKVLAPHQAAQVVWFMVDHREAVFSVPPDVEDTIHSRLESVVHGRQHMHMELTYCHQVSNAEFRRQQTDDTQSALVALMNTILDDTKLSLKEKKQRLKQFSKHHPQLHRDHFAHLH